MEVQTEPGPADRAAEVQEPTGPPRPGTQQGSPSTPNAPTRPHRRRTTEDQRETHLPLPHLEKMESETSWWPAPVQAPSVPAAPEPAHPWDEPAPHPWDEPAPQRKEQSKPRGRLGAALAAVIAFLAKFKSVLLLLPKLKLLTTVGTMLVSVAAYSFVFGWQFAIGFVALIFVHEMGHVIQLRREGLKASAPMFIPFMGAVISARSLGNNALAEARVGLAGPILGSVGSAACIVLWQVTGNDLWRALAFTGFFLNLFNLLPVVPLDGGRAMAAMAPWMWFVGFAGIIPLALIFPNPIILLVLVFAGFETYRRWKLRRVGGVQQWAYYRVRPLHRLLVAAVYLSLLALLVVGMHATTLTKTFA
jgi:Zn-dependent protease